ncbi:MAG: hypothetical protein IKI88_01115 [Anaerotignum sp.]|nr:hypothetical protein [Anaerotignum sp.]
MFSEKLTEAQIREIMNVISDDGAVKIISIRTYDTSFEDSLAISNIPEVKAEFQETVETYQLYDYHIRGFNRAGAGSDYIYRKMMLEWFGDEYAIRYLMEN